MSKAGAGAGGGGGEEEEEDGDEDEDEDGDEDEETSAEEVQAANAAAMTPMFNKYNRRYAVVMYGAKAMVADLLFRDYALEPNDGHRVVRFLAPPDFFIMCQPDQVKLQKLERDNTASTHH